MKKSAPTVIKKENNVNGAKADAEAAAATAAEAATAAIEAANKAEKAKQAAEAAEANDVLTGKKTLTTTDTA